MRRVRALAVLCVGLVGCGGGDRPVQLPKGGRQSTALVYRGATSQRQALRVDAADRLRAELKLLLSCRDGGHTEATLATEPQRPELQSDGSFVYTETGRANFAGFGDGRYHAAMAGQLQGDEGTGRASFRITFRSTSCRSNVTWRVRRV